MDRARRVCASSCLVGLVLAGATGCPDPDPIEACGYRTLQEAIDRAPVGWRVHICDGVHDQAVVLTRPIELYGSGPEAVLTGGGAEAIATIRSTTGPVRLRQLTLQPPAGSSATTTGVLVDGSAQVTLADLAVDFTAVVLPPAQSTPTDFPVLPGFVGIDVVSSDVAIRTVVVHAIGPDRSFSEGVRIRGSGTVTIDAAHIDQIAGPGIESTDADVHVTNARIENTITDGVSVLAGNLDLADSTVVNVQQDALSASGGFLRAERVTITAPGRHGVLAAGGVVDLDTTTITGSGEGIHAAFGGVTATRCTIADARTAGIHVHDSGFVVFDQGEVKGGLLGALVDDIDGFLTLRDSGISHPAEHGLLLHDGQVAMTGGSIDGSGREGVLADGGGGLFDGVTISASGADGVVATGTTDLSATNMTIIDNAGFGLSCDGGTAGSQPLVSLMACTGTFERNGLGRFRLFNGCQLLYMCIEL